MSNEATKFPVAIIHFAAHPIIGGIERVVVYHAQAIARLGYPVRLIVGSGGKTDQNYILRRIPELDPLNPRISAITESLNNGVKSDDLEDCVIDTATALARELVGVGTVFLHDVMTSPLNLVLAEAVRRLEFGSRGKKPVGTPPRRWINWTHNVSQPDAPLRKFTKKGAPWSILKTPLANAVHVAPSADLAGELAKAQKIAKSKIHVVPSGISISDELELTPNITELVRANNLFASKGILFTPARFMPNKNLTETLALIKQLKGYTWILTGSADAHSPSSQLKNEFLKEREKFSLEERVILLSHDSPKMISGTTEADRRALMRLADALLLPSSIEGLGLPVLEAATLNKLIILGTPKQPTSKAAVELLGSDKGVIKCAKSDTPKTFAKKIIKGLSDMPLFSLRRRLFTELDDTRMTENCLLPLINGDSPKTKKPKRKKAKAKSKKK